MYVEYFNTVKMIDILKNGLDIPLERHDRRSQDRVSTILRNLGWVKVHTRIGKIWQKEGSQEPQGHTATPETTKIVTHINKEALVPYGERDKVLQYIGYRVNNKR
jgi:hypothetical protein